jgi:DNA modification methylase
MKPIFTARVGKNNVLFYDILKLYVPNGSVIADVTYGDGHFWEDIPESRYKVLKFDIKTGIDLRKLPYDSSSIDALVIDPPYAHNSTAPIKINIAQRYNLNSVIGRINIRELYIEGAREGYRVLKDNAILIVKCQDEIEGGKQIWNHIILIAETEKLGYSCVDLFVLIQISKPVLRHKYQKHARKNHSYFLIFEKGKGLREKGYISPEKSLLDF